MRNAFKKITIIIIPFMVLGQVPFTFMESHAAEQSVEQFVEMWLLDTCDVGEEGQSEKMLVEYGAVAERLLIEALKRGPDERLIKEYHKSLQKRWERRQKVLGSTKGEALARQDAAAMRQTTKEDYLKRQTDAFHFRYRERAIQGMGIVGTDESREVLERYLKEEQFILRDTAAKALDEIKKRQ